MLRLLPGSLWTKSAVTLCLISFVPVILGAVKLIYNLLTSVNLSELKFCNVISKSASAFGIFEASCQIQYFGDRLCYFLPYNKATISYIQTRVPHTISTPSDHLLCARHYVKHFTWMKWQHGILKDPTHEQSIWASLSLITNQSWAKRNRSWTLTISQKSSQLFSILVEIATQGVYIQDSMAT